jgi:hypothetical protein
VAQLALLKTERFDPLPHGSRQYVAALQNKPGELDALREASSETWNHLTPLMQIVGPKHPGPTISSDSVREWIKKVAEAVGQHPLFLDAVRLRPNYPVAVSNGTAPALTRMYWNARRRGLQFVPVAWVGTHTDAHLRLIADAVDEDDRGVALRYPVRALVLPPRMSQKTYLSRVLDAVRTDVSSADLLIDLDFMDDDVEIAPEDLGRQIEGALAVGKWRSVVLLGTSMPSMLSCVPEGTMRMHPRHEWEVWRALSTVKLSRRPSFGDYAVQHSQPPHDDGGPGMRANIRYTVAKGTLVARGHGSVLQEGNEQYQWLCQRLVASNEFSGGNYTWGDGVIADCARGDLDPGAQRMWRGAGTSHHLRFVTDQLQRLRTAA